MQDKLSSTLQKLLALIVAIVTINAKNVSITALVIPTTMLENFITTLSTATESAVIVITSCVVENYLTCDIQAVDE